MPDFRDIPAVEAQENVGVFKGQVWSWYPDKTADDGISCLITRVARDGSWADLRCYGRWGNSWGKRQKLPFPDTFELTPEYVPHP